METNNDIQVDEKKTNSSGTDRATVIKYISPRVITPRLSTSFQGSLNSIVNSSNINSNYSPTATTTHGLATLARPARFSTIPSIHSIDGERIIDELRELSRITETLANTILDYCNLVAHNRAQELQIEWLENHGQENGSVIEKMFQTEMENAQKLITDSLQKKSTFDMKLNETSQTTMIYDEQYKQLLSKRNLSDRELFDLDRQIAQNNAESQFLKRRIHHFDDEMKFYMVKNRLLHDRRVRLRYELDQEIFSQQSLKMEVEVLENDKITHEDIHLSTLDDLQQSIDISQISSIQPSKYFSQQFNLEVQRIREEYEKKIEVYRNELHRQLELELYRYQIQKSASSPMVTREQEFKLEQYQHENNDVLQQIAAVRGSNNQIIQQIESIEKRIVEEKNDQQSIVHMRTHLETLNQLIRDRERQLEDALRIRYSMKEEIEYHRKRLECYSKEKSREDYNKRASMQESNHLSTRRSTSRLSLQESLNHTEHSKRHQSIIEIDDLSEEGTLIRFEDFNIDQDCEELHRLLTDSNIDEGGLVRILCNRSTGQRLQIREKYKNLFHQNLGEILQKLLDKNLSKLLHILLSSPIERDCLELRRILKGRQIDINILAEIIFTRSNKHLQTIRDTYQTLFKNTLEQDITSEENNPSQRIYLALLQSNRREENGIDENEILNDARHLHETQSKWKTDESTLLRLLCARSNSQLRQIFIAYGQCSGTDIEQAIQAHTDGNLQHTLLVIVQILRNRSRFFANQLKLNIRGAATNIVNLNRIIVSRCEIDMVQIKSEYEKLVKRTLYDHIQSGTSGNYQQALLELIRQRTEPTNRSRHFNNRTELSRIPSSVHWEKPITRITSDISIKHPFTRSSSDRSIHRRRPDHDENHSFHSPFDSNNQAKSGSLATIITNQRVFISMPTTVENHSQLNNENE